jgi:GNAT superfamily N-acetyltransferase
MEQLHFLSIIERDAPAFRANAHRETSRLTFGASSPDEQIAREIEREMAKARQNPDTGVIGYLGDTPVGLAMVEEREREGRRFIWVHFFYIASEFRGQGYGVQLLDYAAAFARRRGYGEYCLRTSELNPAAVRFYERNGFVHNPDGDRVRNGVRQLEYVKNTAYTIRPMTPDDYDECYPLWRVTSEADARTDMRREIITRILARNPDTCFVALADGRIVGTIAAEFGGDGVYISHLAVALDYRRRGIAGALLDAAEQKLLALGVRKSRILVFADNEIAKPFWKSRGYAAREDVIFMDRKLY